MFSLLYLCHPQSTISEIMKKSKIVFLLFLFLTQYMNAQNSDFDTVLSLGNGEYKKGNYAEAIEYFKQAHKLNRKVDVASYKLALTYLALQDNKNALLYSGNILDKGESYREDAYLINAAAWENLGRKKKAQKTYKKGIKEFPQSYLMNYNLALYLFNIGSLDDAEVFVIRAIELAPEHGSSHLLLSYIMFEKGQCIKSMLPLYYFLLIEQDSDRSLTAYDMLYALWNQGVRNNSRREIKLVEAGFSYSDFGKAELELSLFNSLKNEGETAKGLVDFAGNSKALFRVLKESYLNRSGFWWDNYVDFFLKMEDDNLSEPFSYFISKSRYNEDVLLWLSNHNSEFQRFLNWIELQ
jgi:tetratricopeptide (TPR) repeat protein